MLKSHIFFYYILKVITGVLSLGIIVLFVQLAGHSAYGQYALLFSIVVTVNNGLSGWINQVVLKFYNFNKRNRVLSKFLEISIFLSIIFGVAILFVFNLVENYILSNWVVVFLFVSIFIYSLCNVFLQKSFSLKQISLLEAARVFSLVSITLLYYAMNKELTLYALLMITSLSYFCPVIFFVKKYIRYENIFNSIRIIIKNKKAVQIYLLYGVPVGLWLMSASLLNLSDRYIIGKYFSYNEVGIYSSVYDIVYKICTFALSPILTAVHPHIMTLYHNKSGEYKTVVKKAVIMELKILPYLLLTLIVISLFSQSKLNISPKEFSMLAVPILFGSFFWNLSMVLHKMLEVRGKTLTMLYYIIIALLLNIVTNMVFIPIFGFIAAAYTTILSFMTYLYLVWLHVRKELSIS